MSNTTGPFFILGLVQPPERPISFLSSNRDGEEFVRAFTVRADAEQFLSTIVGPRFFVIEFSGLLPLATQIQERLNNCRFIAVQTESPPGLDAEWDFVLITDLLNGRS